MTREEAIKKLGLLRIFDAPGLSEAVRMAIDALHAKPLGGEAAPGLSEPEARPRLDGNEWEGCNACSDEVDVDFFMSKRMIYCPYCGRPITEEAWAELERRINDGTNDLCKAFAQLEPREISH